MLSVVMPSYNSSCCVGKLIKGAPIVSEVWERARLFVKRIVTIMQSYYYQARQDTD